MGYWTYEKCLEEALKYSTKTEFKSNSSSAYGAARKNGWVDKICNHMTPIAKIRGFWTKERCFEVALLFKTKTEFSKKAPSAYDAAHRKGWLSDICKHMPSLIKHWTKKICKIEALKYQTKSVFRAKSNKAYNAAYRNGWLESICKHMTIEGNVYKRCIYAYEFEDNHVYVGLTCNIERRHLERMSSKKDAVKKYNDENPSVKYKRILLSKYVDVNIAVKLENKYLAKYIKKGWIPLNKAKTGSVGGIGYEKWSYEMCKEIALNCSSKKEFRKISKGAYIKAYKNKWLDEICNHML